jgi:hypothetical protein
MILAVGLALAGKQRTQRPGGGKARQVGGAQVRLQRRRKRDQGPMATTVALCWMLRSSRSRAAPGGAGWGGPGSASSAGRRGWRRATQRREGRLGTGGDRDVAAAGQPQSVS